MVQPVYTHILHAKIENAVLTKVKGQQHITSLVDPSHNHFLQ